MDTTRQRLKGANSETEAQALYHELRASGTFLQFAQEYMHDADYQIARNALWTLTKATDDELLSLQPLLHPLIDQALTATNSSVRRLTLNLIERLPMTEDDLRTDFLDFCLEHALDVNEFPGIQSLCLKLAHRIARFYPELMEELLRTLQSMEIDYYKPAVRSVRKRILAGKLKTCR